MSFSIDHVAWSKEIDDRPGTLLVVALHGRGANEDSMIGLVPYLPTNVTVAALRAPLGGADSYAWFENRGIGRPVEESIKAVGEGIFDWLESVKSQHTGVVLLGFSGGTAMAGGLLFTKPEQFSGAILLSGTLPWDAGFDSAQDRFKGIPIFWANDRADQVIPNELVARSEAWLVNESGADLHEHHYDGIDHSISLLELKDIQKFINSLQNT